MNILFRDILCICGLHKPWEKDSTVCKYCAKTYNNHIIPEKHILKPKQNGSITFMIIILAIMIIMGGYYMILPMRGFEYMIGILIALELFLGWLIYKRIRLHIKYYKYTI